MDPNELLRLLRFTIKQLRVEDKLMGSEMSSATAFLFRQHARDIAEYAEALDTWLSNDGVLPTDWLADEEKTCTCGAVEVGDMAQHLAPCPLVTA
jgi:hypothetical protein